MIKLRSIYIIFLITAVFFLVAGRPFSVGANTTASGNLLLDLINQYREAPYAHAVVLGYDPVHLSTIGIFPDTRFEPYEPDDFLTRAALNDNVHAALPDTEPLDPVFFDRQKVVQTGVVLTFFNFIAEETAAKIFAENMMKNELNTGSFEYVLASEFMYAGASLHPGVQDGRNAWFATLMLGVPAGITDMQMLNLINQVRAEPGLASAFMSGEMEAVLKLNPQIYLLPALRFQPLFFDRFLYEFARADVMTPDLVSIGPDNRMILNTGGAEKTWSGERFQSVTAATSWKNMEEARPVADLFKALLYQEVSVWPRSAVIFSNQYSEAGPFVHLKPMESPDIQFKAGIQESAGTQTASDEPHQSGSGVVTVCAGSVFPVVAPSPAEKPVFETARIYGLLYFDQNDDNIYMPGEEVAEESVFIYPLSEKTGNNPDGTDDPAFRLITDNAGHFALSLETGRYWVFEARKEEQFSRRIIYIENDRFVKMAFSPLDNP
jgi:hypothetical protein